MTPSATSPRSSQNSPTATLFCPSVSTTNATSSAPISLIRSSSGPPVLTLKASAPASPPLAQKPNLWPNPSAPASWQISAPPQLSSTPTKTWSSTSSTSELAKSSTTTSSPPPP